jgi:hypothetical protein
LTPEAARLLGPLRLGLSREELAVLYPDQIPRDDASFTKMYLVDPSRYLPSTDLLLDSGVSVIVALYPDHGIVIIATDDPRVRFRSGLGVGSPWREIKRLATTQTYHIFGRAGRYLAACDGWWLRLPDQFSEEAGRRLALPLPDDATVYRIELRDSRLPVPLGLVEEGLAPKSLSE